jgi:hypothetical protein
MYIVAMFPLFYELLNMGYALLSELLKFIGFALFSLLQKYCPQTRIIVDLPTSYTISPIMTIFHHIILDNIGTFHPEALSLHPLLDQCWLPIK